VIPLAVIPRLPGIAALLRVAWIERRDFEPTKNAQFLKAAFLDTIRSYDSKPIPNASH
jgi:hypothetical protein